LRCSNFALGLRGKTLHSPRFFCEKRSFVQQAAPLALTPWRNTEPRKKSFVKNRLAFQRLHNMYFFLPSTIVPSKHDKFSGEELQMNYKHAILAGVGVAVLALTACNTNHDGHRATRQAQRNAYRVENAVHRANHDGEHHRSMFNIEGNDGYHHRRTGERVHENVHDGARNTFRYNDTRRGPTMTHQPESRVRVADRFDGTERIALADNMETVSVAFMDDDAFALSRGERKAMKRKLKEEQQTVPVPATPEAPAAPVYSDTEYDDVPDATEVVPITPEIPAYTPPATRNMK
jgi:hypothetical protein